jgi:2-polyprenyl-3-methyl-5-hydroxy-6-metoxy-1,4-benzoquinol methylase
METTSNPRTTEAFVNKVLGDTVGLTNTVLAFIGDDLGLWKDLAAQGPATSADLARRTGLAERPVREWLHAMTAAGYLVRCPDSHTFALPPEHTPVLAQEAGPMFFGGVHQEFIGLIRPLDRIVESFRSGRGVAQSAYPELAYDGMDRFTAGWFENLLLPVWIPAVGLAPRLEAGIEVADVGCGRGRALIKMAHAFPRSRFVGYDVYAPNVTKARRLAEAAGVADRVRFVDLDAAEGLPASYDLVTTFDVVHDSADPSALLRAIRRALRPDGTYLCLDINCSPNLDENAGPLGALFYGSSVLYCMSTSLAHGGAGLGTCGLHEPKLRELGEAAGFGRIRRVPLENPFNNLYELRP